MNILTDNLPDTVLGYHIHTDYKCWILFDRVIQDDDLDDATKAWTALCLVMKDNPASIDPGDVEGLFRGLIEFYTGEASSQEQTAQEGQGQAVQAYDYDIDQALILAAFQQAYGIDLTTADMHWWRFRALLQGLPDSTRFVTIVGYRTVDTRDMPKKTAQQYNALKARYAIKKQPRYRTHEEMKQATLSHIDDLFKRAEEYRKQKQTGGDDA